MLFRGRIKREKWLQSRMVPTLSPGFYSVVSPTNQVRFHLILPVLFRPLDIPSLLSLWETSSSGPYSCPSFILPRILCQEKLFSRHRNASKAPSKFVKANLEAEVWDQMETLGMHLRRTELAQAWRRFVTHSTGISNQVRSMHISIPWVSPTKWDLCICPFNGYLQPRPKSIECWLLHREVSVHFSL